MKKFLAILLTILMLLPMFSTMAFAGTTVTPDENADPGTPAYEAWLKSEGYTAISNFDNFKASITGNPAGKYYLTADIVDTFGDDFMSANFTGAIDGNGHTLYNWRSYITSNTITGTIKNITISKYKDLAETETNVATWSLFCKILGDGARIENVVNYRDSGEVSNYYGIFAREVSGKDVNIINCVNYGGMDSRYSSNNHKCGGFIGIAKDGADVTFDGCINYGDIRASHAGGFIGSIDKNSTVTLKFKDCTNAGTITGTAGSSGIGISGGFIGATNNRYDTGVFYDITFENCTNTGDVLRYDGGSNDKSAAQGGFMGWIKATTLNLTMTNCVVRDCTINGKGENNTAGSNGEASGLIGRLIPNSANGTVLISNCTVENVVVDAQNGGRKFAFLCGNSSYPVTLVNCFANNVKYSNGNDAKLFEKGAMNVSYSITEESQFVSINKAQQSTPVDDMSNVRFIGTVDGLAYTEIGYYIEYNGYAVKQTNNVVYKALSDNFGVDSITADSLGAKYLTSIVMTDLPTSASGTINVTPYVKKADGTYIYGKTKGIEINSGEIGECL